MMNKAKIQKMINTAPKQWVDMFQHHGLGKKPTVDKLIDVVLDYTPTMRSSGAEGKAKYVPTKKVRQEAWKRACTGHTNTIGHQRVVLGWFVLCNWLLSQRYGNDLFFV